MDVSDYQIEMLDVEAADAFILLIKTSDNSEFLILIDSGNYKDGDKIIAHLKQYYQGHDIDLAIVSHCDKDHYGGFVRMLEKINDDDEDSIAIRQFWVNDPTMHDIDVNDVKYKRTQNSVDENLKSVYTLENDLNLLDLIDSLSIPRFEQFAKTSINWEKLEQFAVSDSFFDCITILGPTEKFYESLILDMRNNLEATSATDSAQVFAEASSKISFDDVEDDNSAHNKSSLIFLFKVNGKKYLFSGDATRLSFEKVPNSHKNLMKDVHWFKVPHHGSDHNLNTNLLNDINPKTAYISTKEIKNDRYPNVVDALKEHGCNVYSTHVHGTLLHNGNRDGWTTAKPL